MLNIAPLPIPNGTASPVNPTRDLLTRELQIETEVK